MLYISFNKSGISEWYDSDNSQVDGRKYYPAPKDIAPGTICKLVNNEFVVMPQNEIEKLNKKQ